MSIPLFLMYTTYFLLMSGFPKLQLFICQNSTLSLAFPPLFLASGFRPGPEDLRAGLTRMLLGEVECSERDGRLFDVGFRSSDLPFKFYAPLYAFGFGFMFFDSPFSFS